MRKIIDMLYFMSSVLQFFLIRLILCIRITSLMQISLLVS